MKFVWIVKLILISLVVGTIAFGVGVRFLGPLEAVILAVIAWLIINQESPPIRGVRV